jgi:hydantoinase/carbamoylase family amidase
MDLRINSKRLWSDLTALGRIGYQEGKGVTRTALSDSDLKARDWLAKRMHQAGLDVRVDAAGNMIGRLPVPKADTEKVAGLGSHIDTVAQGGRFDGALGVLAALECARIIKEKGIQLPWHLEVINFCDEEAAHNAGTVGSRAMMGLLQEGEIYKSRYADSPSFAQDLSKIDKDPALISEARRDPASFVFFLELHIEQGRQLEERGLQIGIVTDIVGIYRYLVTVAGRADHAGGTPMELRRDALVLASPFFTLLPEWLREQNPAMVGTIGQLALEPGSVNVVPGRCRFSVELRSQLPVDMKAVRDRLFAYADKRDQWQVQTIYEKDGVSLSQTLVDSIARATDIEGFSHMRMPSGAGHDAQSLAPFLPSGMIFTPCKNGLSHNPNEWIDPEQAAAGCQTMLRTVLLMAGLS